MKTGKTETNKTKKPRRPIAGCRRAILLCLAANGDSTTEELAGFLAWLPKKMAKNIERVFHKDQAIEPASGGKWRLTSAGHMWIALYSENPEVRTLRGSRRELSKQGRLFPLPVLTPVKILKKLRTKKPTVKDHTERIM